MNQNATAGDQPPHATIHADVSVSARLAVGSGQVQAPQQAPASGRAKSARRKPGRQQAGGQQPQARQGAGKRRKGKDSGRPGRDRQQAGSRGLPTVVRVGSPASLLALVPQLLGFEPADSMVLIGSDPPRGRVRLTLRFDLPPESDREAVDDLARHLVAVMTAQGIGQGVAVGYGPASRVTPVADALREHAAWAGLALTEVLRADDGRYWSYVCHEPTCCPPEGVPYDTASDRVTAAFRAAGAPPVLASREELAATVAPVGGAEEELMAQATALAEEQSALLIAEAGESGRDGAARRMIRERGLDAVGAAIGRYRAGGQFGSGLDAAWLAVALRDLRVRDDAWSRMEPRHVAAHLRLWTDLTRRARPGYVAAPACLLAFTAWQSGNGALANVALDRAQDDDPGYSMAALLREIIEAGIPPDRARVPMTPEDVAVCYEQAEEEQERAQARAARKAAFREAEPREAATWEPAAREAAARDAGPAGEPDGAGDSEPGDSVAGDGEPGDSVAGDGEPGDGEPGDGEPGAGAGATAGGELSAAAMPG